MREGTTEAAFYLQKDLFGEARYHRLVTNGFSMSATVYRAKRYMRLFAYAPLALRPSSERALLISYGIGVTAKALTESESLQLIDVVDISRNIVDLSRQVRIFAEPHPLTDTRVRVHIEDGRFFLQTTDERYDLITAEPPPPKNAGIVNLYTREYFQLLHDRLAPQGIATYWLPVYQLDEREAKSVTRAFCLAFSDCSLWTGAGLEWMLMGTRGLEGPVPLVRAWRELGTGLATIGVERPEQLGTLFLADAAFLETWTENAPPLEDDHPHRIRAGLRYRSEDGGPDPEVYRRLMRAEATRERFRRSD